MKRTWTMLIVIAMAVVVALPATAKKPDKPKPPAAAPLAVSVGAQPIWVHEGNDHLAYSVTLENKTAANIDDVTVKFTAADTTDVVTGVTVPANGSATLDGFSRFVWEFPEAESCIDDDITCDLHASVALYRGNDLVTEASMTSMLDPEPSCSFDANGEALVDGMCIWSLGGETGVWAISLEPTPPDNPKRPIGASVSVRDGVPGNWCTLAIDGSWTFGGRWKVGDGPIVGAVYLPGDENMETLEFGDGMCLGGGAGGDYFAVGNPDSFYLRTDGYVTVTWCDHSPELWYSSPIGDPPESDCDRLR